MIYTSYFANISKLPRFTIPISIALKPIPNWAGLQYRPLNPTPEILYNWKVYHNTEKYCADYYKDVLATLSPNIVVRELHEKTIQELENLHLTFLLDRLDQTSSKVWNSKDVNIALLCYEKPEDFCHRHLVAEWLTKYGFLCSEYKPIQTFIKKKPEKYILSF